MTIKFRLWLGAAVVAAMAQGSWSAQAEQLNVATYGGTMDNWSALYFKPFQAKSGNTVVASTWENNLALIDAMVKAKNVTWDVVDVGGESIQIACERGLILPVDYDAMGGKDRFVAGAAEKCGIASFMSASGFAFDSASFPGAKPSKIEDVFDVAKFPGKRTFRLSPIFTFEMALLADGVPPEKLYDVLGTEDGVTRAFAKLGSIKDQIVWNNSAAQTVQLMIDKEVVFGQAAWDLFKNTAIKTNRDFQFIWDGSSRVSSYWAIVNGTPHLETAKAFLKFVNDPDVQGKWGELNLFHAPPVKAVMDRISPERAMLLATYPANDSKRHYTNSTAFWGDHLEDYTLRLNKWAGK